MRPRFPYLPTAASLRDRILRPLAGDVALLAFLAVCVVALTWPWAATFGHAFAHHWDPPLHAWKVWNMAEAILQGHIRPPGIDLNAYYPNSGSLYYESLYWPQGVVAAPVLALTGNPILAFHLTYLFFWALSGVIFRRMLEEFGAGRAAALFGAVVFTIIPYRTGYVSEFNMQLCFGLPLCLLFVARWFRTERPVHAALAAGALCLQATSELYQAVFLCFCFPFLFLSLLWGRCRRKLFTRRFLLSLAAAAAVCAVFVLIFFLPYFQQLDGSVSRSIREIARHEIEPFSFLASRKQMRWCLLPPFSVKQREICVYPTLAILLVSFGHLAWRFRRRFRAEAAKPAERILRTLRAAGLVFFLLATAIGLLVGRLGAFSGAYAWTPVVLSILSFVIPFVSSYENEEDRLLDGLCGGALFAFLMALGPQLAPIGKEWSLESPLFLALYRASSVLHGFRVVARFCILVLLFLVASAALAWNRLLAAFGKGPGLRAAAVRWAWAPALALIVVESVPRPIGTPREGTPLPVTVLSAAPGGGNAPVALAMIPSTDRNLDAMHMFRIAGADPNRLLVMSWGGAIPDFTQRFAQNYSRLHDAPEHLHNQLATIWPECLLLRYRRDFNVIYPIRRERRNTIIAGIESIADPIAEDENFTLYRLHPLPPSTCVEKAVRSDFVQSSRDMAFRIVPARDDASPDGPVRVEVSFNGQALDTLTVSPERESFTLPLAGLRCDPVNPNVIRFRADVPISVEDFRLEPAESRRR